MKSSAHSPLCGYYLYKTWDEAFRLAGVENNGVVNFLSGDGASVTNYLLTHLDVASYDFTGSFSAYEEIRKTVATARKRKGGFYAHFGSKDDLIAAAVGRMFQEAREMFRGATEGKDRAEGLRSYINAYVSKSHRDQPERGCAGTATHVLQRAEMSKTKSSQ